MTFLRVLCFNIGLLWAFADQTAWMAKSSLEYAIHRNIVHAMQKPILLCRPYFPELKLREKRLRYPELQRHAAKQKTRVLRGCWQNFFPNVPGTPSHTRPLPTFGAPDPTGRGSRGRNCVDCWWHWHKPGRSVSDKVTFPKAEHNIVRFPLISGPDFAVLLLYIRAGQEERIQPGAAKRVRH